jgi:hypothetical protein
MSLLCLGAAILCLTSNEAQPDLLKRVQAVQAIGGSERITKDDAGNIVRLRLDEMTLSAADFAAIGRMASLQSLSLNKTNVTDKDLRQFQNLEHLRWLALSSTEITDDAMAEIAQLPALKTLCLGSVKVSPAAIDRLKEAFEADGRKLSLGYSQRR